jgi:hypothetical protein
MPAERTLNRSLYAAALAGAVVIAAVLYAWGQPLICRCGYVRFWVGSVFSNENSQQIADWYTLSHMVHGMLIILVGRLLFPRASVSALFVVAIVTGVSWEIVEHTDMVLNRFRATTLYQGYVGDSVLNAVSDYLWMLGGFFVANALPTVWVIVSIAILEITAAVTARDSLVLTTIMVVHPIEAISEWQQELNPNARPGP